MSNVVLQIQPKHSLVDSNLQIVVRGLRPGQEVTLIARLTENTNAHVAYACFEATPNGVVDVNNQPSLSGTYTGN